MSDTEDFYDSEEERMLPGYTFIKCMSKIGEEVKDDECYMSDGEHPPLEKPFSEHCNKKCSTCEYYGFPCASCAEDAKGIFGPGWYTTDAKLIPCPYRIPQETFLNMIKYVLKSPNETFEFSCVTCDNVGFPCLPCSIILQGKAGPPITPIGRIIFKDKTPSHCLAEMLRWKAEHKNVHVYVSQTPT